MIPRLTSKNSTASLDYTDGALLFPKLLLALRIGGAHNSRSQSNIVSMVLGEMGSNKASATIIGASLTNGCIIDLLR